MSYIHWNKQNKFICVRCELNPSQVILLDRGVVLVSPLTVIRLRRIEISGNTIYHVIHSLKQTKNIYLCQMWVEYLTSNFIAERWCTGVPSDCHSSQTNRNCWEHNLSCPTCITLILSVSDVQNIKVIFHIHQPQLKFIFWL